MGSPKALSMALAEAEAEEEAAAGAERGQDQRCCLRLCQLMQADTMSRSSEHTALSLQASKKSRKLSSWWAPPPLPPRWLHTVSGSSPPARAMGAARKAQGGRGEEACAQSAASMRACRACAALMLHRCSLEDRRAQRRVRVAEGSSGGGRALLAAGIERWKVEAVGAQGRVNNLRAQTRGGCK